MDPLPRTTVETPSGTVAYAERGHGPAALFVHGVIVNAGLWRHQLDDLSDRRRCNRLPVRTRPAAQPCSPRTCDHDDALRVSSRVHPAPLRSPP
ncbi:hypothetical protein ACLFMI_21275 [Pseudonocardia nantongensis]